MTVDPVIVVICRWLLALLFASAAWHKISDWTAYRIVVHDYEILPRALVTPAAAGFVVAEMVAALTLPWRAATETGVALVVVLLVAYSLAITVNLARGRRELECGCTPSVYRQPLSAKLLVRNAILLVVACVALLPTTERAISWVDASTVFAAVASGTLLWNASQLLMSTSAGRIRV
ncbi:MAG: methylamine utilization protein MauE [Myxococcales bacterium]|nr:MAG: methylamine utilization protein MauE [Myxococcales bacterium]